ncbi:MAG: DUF2924 domain-containing protein [Terracidiphilus sp.]
MEKKKITQPKPTRRQAVDQLLTQLPTMSRKALLKLWHDLFDRVPSPALRRETLIPILAYRLQEKAFGGLKESTLKRLHELAKNHANGKKSAVQAMIRPKIGTRYVREYGGKLHEVTVLETGYEYQGRVYRSLTEVAKAITGTKWSGPVFFGCKRPGKRAQA